MNLDQEQPRRAGRPPMTVTLTIAELAKILDMTPSGVSKRIERGQDLEAPKRYGMVKDVTDPPKEKPAPMIDPVKQREKDVAEVKRRLVETGTVLDVEAALRAAWDMGHVCGSRS